MRNLAEDLLLTNDINKQQLSKIYEKEILTSPFKTQGNPIPYVTSGVDSPRTFNFKMLEQNKAREEYKKKHNEKNNGILTDASFIKRFRFPNLLEDNINTTLAIDSGNKINYFDSYFTEFDLYNDINSPLGLNFATNTYKDLPNTVPNSIKNISPFLPGLFLDDESQLANFSKSLYSIEKTAGVDSTGMLAGAISISDLSGVNFYNIFNKAVDEELDELFKEKDFNFHYRNGEDSYTPLISRPVRFTNGDIEKVSVLVPNLKDIQQGDILVRYNKSGYPHIGIVISCELDGTETTPEDIMEKTLVLSTRKNFRVANLGLWKSSGNTYGGFTSLGEEKTYQLRRLVKSDKNESSLIEYQDVNWEFINKEVMDLDVDIELQKDRYDSSVKARWIPNTKEILNIGKIKISGNYSDGSVGLLPIEKNDIKILAPTDPYNDEAPLNDPVDSNIFKNKGSQLKFYALGDNDLLLVAFNRNAISGEYDIVYNTAFFDANGKAKNGYELKVKSGYLTFTNNRYNITNFGVKADGTDIIPGDDFLLNFALLNNDKIKGGSTEKDLIAVYDKKMLWRANLYIDETKLNKTDWNNLNPWVEGNEWNVNNAGVVVTNNELKGKQVVSIEEYSPIRSVGKDKINFAVAYSYPLTNNYFHDSPQEFNYKILEQQKLLKEYYNVDGKKFYKPRSEWKSGNTKLTSIEQFTAELYKNFIDNNINENMTAEEFKDFDKMSLVPWDSTLAPKSNNKTYWNNYIKENISNGSTDIKTYLPGLGLMTWYGIGAFNFPQEWIYSVVDSVEYKGDVTYDNNDKVSWAKKSAGLDCVGFAQRSATWGGFYK